MIKNKKQGIYLAVAIAVAIAFLLIKIKGRPSQEIVHDIRPAIGTIQTVITSTAIVQPQNRLEIKPPINGRIDEILVKEGEDVKAGQTLVWMSSTERAALLDAARARGPDEMKYWEGVYKPTPLISPIDGEVIVSTDEPGQVVTSADAVVVLSDRLIVQAQVDETDIGKVRIGQDALIGLDAYPAIKVRGKVDHIYYESKIVNNVTIYQVDILPDEVPDVFRSGMSATVNIVETSKKDILTIPIEAVRHGKDGSFVFVRRGIMRKPVTQKVELGISDEKNVEIGSGISADDTIVITTQRYTPSSGQKSGTSPFMPAMRRPR